MSEPSQHPMLRWIEASDISIGELAEAARCSEEHLRNLFAGRRGASLALAIRLSDLTEGAVPMDAFLRPIAGAACA